MEGRDIRFETADRKGRWLVLSVERHDYRKGPAFKVLAEFIPSPDAGLKASSSLCGYTFMQLGEDQRWFVSGLTMKLGYTPTPRAATVLFGYVTEQIGLMLAEDAYYRAQDRNGAQAMLQGLMQSACERLIAGGNPLGTPAPSDPWWLRPIKTWLTDAERCSACEAQKVLNGHAAEDNEHLKPFGDIFRPVIERAEWEKARRESAVRHIRLLALLDTEPDFRRLVAHYSAAKRTAYGSIEYELTYRLFGYCRDLDEYHTRRAKLAALLACYDLQPDQIGEFDSLIDREWDCLPVVVAPFERKDSEFYYGDRVRYCRPPLPGEYYTTFAVNRSTRDNLYLSSGAGRVSKISCTHVSLSIAA